MVYDSHTVHYGSFTVKKSVLTHIFCVGKENSVQLGMESILCITKEHIGPVTFTIQELCTRLFACSVCLRISYPCLVEKKNRIEKSKW